MSIKLDTRKWSMNMHKLRMAWVAAAAALSAAERGAACCTEADHELPACMESLFCTIGFN